MKKLNDFFIFNNKNKPHENNQIAKRQYLINMFNKYKDQKDIKTALVELNRSTDINLSGKEIYSLWNHVSNSLDNTFGNDEYHIMWTIKVELWRTYISTQSMENTNEKKLFNRVKRYFFIRFG